MNNKLLSGILKYFKTTDYVLLSLAGACTIYGLILIYSATLSFSSNRSLAVQIAALGIGLIGMILLSRLDYNTLCDAWFIFVGLSVLAVIFTLIFGHGPNSASTNRNWISLGPINIQPSELVKIAFIISFSSCLNHNREQINSLRGLVNIFTHFGVYLLLIYVQGDMGTTIIFLFMGLAMIFVSGLNIKLILGFTALAVAAFPLIWNNLLAGYMRDRILFGFNPDLDPLGVGFQAVQSKIAIGSGGLLGKGFTHGTQIQQDLLPAKQTDFIFAVAGEEFGFFGSALVIILLLCLMARVLLISMKAKDNNGALIAFGVFAMLFAQTFENLGMCMGFLPVIGITLPFFSYGGSSILSVWLCMGLVQSVYGRKRSGTLTIT